MLNKATRNIYALLVGIDEYINPVPPLKGCANDILALEEYLKKRVATDGTKLHIRTLLNQDATRQGIIDGFRQHLCQAGSEDVAFFYYAGHGSQEQAPEEFWKLEPDRLNETLVCYDSRSKDSWDLADKELAKLIAEVAQKNPHITIILDCCHSGSGTRGELEEDTAVRKAPTDRRKRPLESFIFSLPEAEQLSASRSPEENPTGWTLPRGKHIFLAACRDSELAKEFNGDGQPRGAFSYFLLDTLKKANGNLTYRDLFKRTNALVRSKVTAQSPQIEVTDGKDLDQLFLGVAIAPHSPYFTVYYDKNHGWAIDGGAVHGIPQFSENETTLLALFPFDTPNEGLRQLSATIGKAQVIEVMPQLSKVRFAGVENLAPETTLKAVVTSLPLPPKGVWIVGEEIGVQLARTQLGEQSSLYLREVSTPEQAEFKLLARDRKYWITRPVDDRPIVAEIQGYNSATALQAIQRLEHIARWTNIIELSSPATSRIQPDAVQMYIYREDRELKDVQISLQYQQENGKWKQPSFKIKLKNTSNEALYCALLDLTDRYAVSASLFNGGGVWLQPGEEAWANNADPIYSAVPEKLWREKGITEVKDILKLIVSTAEFDATLLEEDELDLPSRAIKTTSTGGGTLNRLMKRVQLRDLRSKPEEEELYDDWVTSQIAITTVRPQETASIPKEGNSISLGAGVSLRSHPHLKAKARLTTVNQSVRDLGDRILPSILRADREGIKPFSFTVSRGSDPGLNALELTEVQDADLVTRSVPLKLVADTSLEPDEQLLPVGYDGEFFLPLGGACSTFDGKTEIVLERLPNPVKEGSRSLGGSIRIFFQKVVTQNFGLEFEYPILAVADVSPDETVRYTKEIEQVKTRVAQAKRIVVFIHGIIGDTQEMVKSVQRAKVNANGIERPLADLYDLVLTFDYENLNTSIEENAILLKQKLEAVGLGANCGKVLHIVAHSMGGLISRWFIEREGGSRVVQHLIMLGTPNAGSPWSTVQDWALTTLSIGLNNLSEITWPVPILGMLIKAINKGVEAIEAIDVSLDQMHPQSEFLKNLAANSDPGIPYSIIAGNISIIPAALQIEAARKSSPLQRLTQKLFNKAVALPFFGEFNDIAVTVKSIKNVSQARSPQPKIQEIGCDHLTYFSHPQGLAALKNAVIQAQGLSYRSIPISTATPTLIIEPSSSFEKEKPFWLVGMTTTIVAAVAITGLFVWQHFKQIEPSLHNDAIISEPYPVFWH